MSRLEASGSSGPRPEGCRLATCNPQVAPLITHTVPFEQFPEAYEMAEEDKASLRAALAAAEGGNGFEDETAAMMGLL